MGKKEHIYNIEAIRKDFDLDVVVRKMDKDEMSDDGVTYYCEETGQIYTEDELTFTDQPLERMPEETKEEITISDLDVEKQGFMPVAYFLRKWLDKIYPKDIFKIGTDSGSTFVVNLRKLLNELDEEKVNVESLQSGEREELDKIYKQLKRETYSKDKRYNEKGEDLWGDEWAQNDEYHARIYNEGLRDMKNMAMDLLSQSKKEGENDYEIGFNDGWHTCCRENNIENDARILYLRREENINRFKESLTNQKKVI